VSDRHVFVGGVPSFFLHTTSVLYCYYIVVHTACQHDARTYTYTRTRRYPYTRRPNPAAVTYEFYFLNKFHTCRRPRVLVRSCIRRCVRARVQKIDRPVSIAGRNAVRWVFRSWSERDRVDAALRTGRLDLVILRRFWTREVQFNVFGMSNTPRLS